MEDQDEKNDRILIKSLVPHEDAPFSNVLYVTSDDLSLLEIWDGADVHVFHVWHSFTTADPA